VIKTLKDGDPGTFKRMVEEYQIRVISTCYGFLRNREDAEDVAQDVFLEVYKSISRFREEASLSTWIYRIAVTKSLDFIRSRRRKKRFGIVFSIFGMENHEETLMDTSDPGPDVHLESKERARILYDAVDSLPDNQKAALMLSEYEGISNKSIADILNTTVSAVESLIHRAKKNLHKKLFQYYEKQLL
jgi:RNA polymerase sigma-70 factor, ECF subfamily